jgi:hypothetical protein
MDDKNDIQEPADSFGSVTTKAEDKVVTDGRITVKPVPNQQIQKRYMNSKLDYPIFIAGFSVNAISWSDRCAIASSFSLPRSLTAWFSISNSSTLLCMSAPCLSS